MGINQLNFENNTKVQQAIAVIKAWEPKERPYQVCFSGGKDSVVIEHLTKISGVKYDLVYNRTGIDHPELVRFIRDNYPNVIVEKPKMSIWDGIQIHGLPLRQRRWCCELLKEYSGNGRVLITGIRALESYRRKTRCIVEPQNKKRKKTFINPIFLWSLGEVWEYIKANKLTYCKLYDQGYDRLGCILCPMTTWQKTLKEWRDEPKIAGAWFRAAARYWQSHQHLEGIAKYKTPESLIWWWLTRGQISEERLQREIEKLGLEL